MEHYNTDNSVLAEITGQTQLLVAALNASISGIIITDFQLPDNPIIYCNKAFETMTGYSQEEVLGKNSRFLQGEDREQVSRYKLQEAMEQAEECHVEIANYRKDGSVFFNELYIAPVKDGNEIVTHYIGVQNDITIRKLKEASVQLELANSKKFQRLKEEFLTTASHELKTPITSLKGTLQLMNRFFLQEQPDSDRFAVLLNNAERQTVKLTHLVEDLICSTRLVNGELDLNKTSFPLEEVVDGCCSHLTMSGTHQIRKSGDYQMEVYADQHKIDQVLVNLLDNAVKYSPPSEEIIIQVEKLEDKVIIRVTDKGCGIAKEDKQHLFEQYYKVTADGIQNMGLGLGLFIAAEIIRRHGGEIGVESEVGKGSNFWFTIPF